MRDYTIHYWKDADLYYHEILWPPDARVCPQCSRLTETFIEDLDSVSFECDYCLCRWRWIYRERRKILDKDLK